MNKKIHKNCGGLVKDRTCQKCGHKWGRIGYLFPSDIEEVEVPRFDPKAYRERIRKGKDLY